MSDYPSRLRSMADFSPESGTITKIIPQGATFLRETAEYIEKLEDALQAVVNDVNDYERVNKLHPNPGRTECWDSVAHAKSVLANR